MNKKSALKGFCSRFQDILNSFDEFDMDEELEEMNAEMEDTLFMAESIDPENEDAAEEIQDFLDDMDGLLEEYRALAETRPELSAKVNELEMAVRMAAANLV